MNIDIDSPWSCPDGELVIAADASREAWLAARKTLVGASELAQLVGESNYGDAYDLFAEKTDRLPPSPTTDAQRRGQLFEDALIKLWAERFAGFDIVTRRQGLMRSRQHPHIGASVDRLSVCNMLGRWERCLVEAKTAANMTDWEGDEVPLSHQLQGIQQLIVTGRHHVHYPVLGSRFSIEHRVIHRDGPLEEMIVGAIEDGFWAKYMATDTAPTPTARTKNVARLNYKTDPGDVLVIDDELEPHVRAMLAARAEKVEVERVEAEAVNIIKTAMGKRTTLAWEDGEIVATWNAGKTIDGADKDWRKSNAALAEAFMIPGPDVLDVNKMVENHPELLETGQLRKRRTFNVKD